MKLLTSIIVLVFLSSSLFAEDKEKKQNKKGKPAIERPEGKRPHGKRPHGKRSLDDIVKGVKKRLSENGKFAEFFKKRADSDGDGRVSDEEIKETVSKMGEKRKKGKGRTKPKGRPKTKGRPE